MSRDMRFPTMWYVRPSNAQTSLRMRADWSEPLLVAWIFYEVKLPTEHHLELLSFKGGYTGSSESTLVKITHCWKSHAAAQFTTKEYNSNMGYFWLSKSGGTNQRTNYFAHKLLD